MKKLLGEPLLHFMILGAIIFAWYYFKNPDQPAFNEIKVTSGQQEHLITAFSRTWQRPPTPEEFNNLVDDWIREEIAYREAQNMGLDANDTIIRRRLRQKLELLAEDVISMSKPSHEELQQWLDDHSEDYMLEPVYTLHQIYFSYDRRGAAAEQDAVQAVQLLQQPDSGVDPDSLGDPLPLPARLADYRLSALSGQLGQVFADAVQQLEPGSWRGPVQSGFGLHAVMVEEVVPGRELSLDEARQQVERDLGNQRRIDTINALYERLRENYEIVIEPVNTVQADS